MPRLDLCSRPPPRGARFVRGARLASLAALWLPLCVAPAAGADQVRGTRDEAAVRELQHAADVRLRPGSAEIVVRRRVENQGDRHDQAVFDIAAPPGAVAVGLRTLGEQNGRPTWFAAELLDRDRAEARYRELTGVGHAIPKDPALLFWVGPGRLGLQVFPVAPGGSKTVEYTFAAPTRYEGGRYRVDLGSLGQHGSVAMTLRAAGAERLFEGGELVANGATFGFEADAAGAASDAGEVGFERTGAAPRLDGALASVPLAGERSLLRLRVEAARRLSEVPAGASLVVALDASRSLDEEQVRAEVAVARAWLARFPRARAAVLPFDREVRALSDAFVPVDEALRRLDATPIVRRNGSHLDGALARAARLLASAPAGSAKRLLVLTDARAREALTPALVRQAIEGTGALAHLVSASGGEPSLERDDEHAWAKALRATGGLAWTARAGEGPRAAPRAGAKGGGARGAGEAGGAAIFEELARPIRLHHFRLLLSEIEVGAAGSASFEVPEALDEGEGVQFLQIVGGAASRARARGELWATPVQATFSPSAEENRLAAALAVGAPLFDALSEEEQRALAFRGRAVSPLTSYLAIEPGVRPSTEGLLEEGQGEGGGGVGTGLGVGLAGSIGHSARPGRDRGALLREALRRAWRACGGRGPAELTLETTVAEVVDVRGVAAAEPGAKRFEPCLAEAAWSLELPDDFRAEHEALSVSL